jgi:predicted NACHT family NTPase
MALTSFKEIVRKISGASTLLLGLAATLYFTAGNEWKKAFLSFLVTIILTVVATGVRLLKRVKDHILKRIEERLDQSAEELGDLIYSKSEGFILKLWWRINSDFQGDYYEELVYKYRTYKTQGLKTQGPFKPDLQKIFVPLRVAPESPDRISAAMIQARENIGNLEVWDFLAKLAEQPAYRRIAVIGAPGSGKTTLLEQLSLTYAQNKQRQFHHKAPKLIPVLLYLRTIQNEITSDSPPNLVELINMQEFINMLEPPPNWFEEKLKRKKCLIMLDGLDEVADERKRIKVSQWVNMQMETYPDTPFIMTSRPYGYRSASIEQVGLILEIQPFNITQVEEFIYNWYLQNESMRQMRIEDWGVWEEARIQSEDFIERIKSNHALAEMALNPLLLTMIVTVHDNSGKLPERRVELYREICEVLLGSVDITI